MNLDLRRGDSAKVLKTIPDDSVDAIVSDPPYGIDFMGKNWDKTLPPTKIWKECFRVLKPGGYILAMSASRTYHRLAVQLEDLGFITHPMIGWIYGSGFPKATDLSKQFDKGVEREVIGESPSSRPNSKMKGSRGFDGGLDGKESAGIQNITAPSTPLAKKWEGWKYGLQCLKPALESVFVGRKPYEPIDILTNFLDDCLFKIGGEPCERESLLNANIVQKISMLRDRGLIQENIAQEIVQIDQELERGLETGKVDDLLGRMDMFQSLLVEGSISSNIESLWKSTLAVSYCLMNTFITRMRIKRITQSKTLNWWELENIYRDFILQLKLIGEKSDALAAGRRLKNLCVRLKLQLITIVTESVIERPVGTGEDRAGKPNMDTIYMGQKPQVKDDMTKNILCYGVGAMNIDATRVETTDKIESGRGGREESDSIYKDGLKEQPNREFQSTGRHPANLIHDGSESVEAEFLEKGGVGSSNTRNPNGKKLYGGVALHAADTADTTVRGHQDSGTASRFFNKLPYSEDDIPYYYCPKAGKSERNEGLKGDEKAVHRFGKGIGEGLEPDAPSYDKNFHPTVKPIKLMEWMIKLVTPPQGLVLDPFLGSGTTGVAAVKNKFKFLGIERSPEFFRIAKSRVEHYYNEDNYEKENDLSDLKAKLKKFKRKKK